MRKLHAINCRQGAVRAVRYNVDGTYCLTCGSDKTIKLWNPRKSLLLQTYNGHGDDVLDASGSHDSSTIISCSIDKSLLLWDVSSGQVKRRIRAHAAQINCVRFNEDSSIGLSGSVDGTVKCWDLKSKAWEPVQTLDEAKDSVTSICVSDYEIATGSLDGKVRRYDLRMGALNVDDALASVGNIAFTKDGQSILVNSINSRVKLIDKTSGEVLAEFKDHKNIKYRCEGALIDNDSLVAAGSEDGYVYIWKLIEGTLKEKLAHTSHRVVHSIDSHPKGTELMTASEGFAYLWTVLETDDEEAS